jgi:tRNA(Arg) A34 adenosine deaminase TadA
MKTTHLTLELPAWLAAEMDANPVCPTVESRMQLAIRLARRNMAEGGGPFGAVIAERATGRVLSVGVNRVVPGNCSVAHAEIVAIMAAQQRLGHYDLGCPDFPAFELATTTEPCAMCFGAVPWSGVRWLVCGARGEDAGAIGMDEGAKPPQWREELQRRGIGVECDVCRAEARSLLEAYRLSGGVIYNGRQPLR